MNPLFRKTLTTLLITLLIVPAPLVISLSFYKVVYATVDVHSILFRTNDYMNLSDLEFSKLYNQYETNQLDLSGYNQGQINSIKNNLKEDALTRAGKNVQVNYNTSDFNQSTLLEGDKGLSKILYTDNIDPQAAHALGIESSGEGESSTGIEGEGSASTLEGAATEFFECSVASIMATIFTGILSVLGGALAQFIPDFEVPVKDTTKRAKETGLTVFGIPILPSWDAVAYCLANLIIAYIGQAAVEWINTGFGGNPSFIQDPSNFFQGIADIETEKFLYELTESSICSPYTQQIQRNIAYDSLVGFNDRASCTFGGDGGDSLNSFFSNKTAPRVSSFAQFGNPANLYWGAEDLAYQELAGRIGTQQGEQKMLLDWGQGWFSTRGENGLINVIGSLIADQAARRINLPLDRTATAQGINQIIITLLNAIFKVSIGDILGTSSPTWPSNTARDSKGNVRAVPVQY